MMCCLIQVSNCPLNLPIRWIAPFHVSLNLPAQLLTFNWWIFLLVPSQTFWITCWHSFYSLLSYCLIHISSSKGFILIYIIFISTLNYNLSLFLKKKNYFDKHHILKEEEEVKFSKLMDKKIQICEKKKIVLHSFY